jgi:RNA polymerase sigma-70 factor (ECF subfamily)
MSLIRNASVYSVAQSVEGRPDLPADAERLAAPGGGAAASLPSPTSFRQVYQDHFEFVWRYAAHRGIAADARDDVVQEVFMVVYRRLSGFEGRSSIRTWIAGVAINVVRSHRRRNGNLTPELLSLDLPAGGRSAAEALELKQALGIAGQALSQMTELQREAFVLCELDGLSSVEISELLGVNVNTVRTRLRGARRLFEEFTRKVRLRAGVKP